MTVSAGTLNGVELLQWGAHDRVYPFSARLGQHAGLLSRHGRHPVFSCDRYSSGGNQGEHLLADLLSGVARKRALLLDVPRSEDWDLFTCVLSESHCVGHHFWHFHDATHPAHDPRTSAHMRDAIATVYAGLDETVGALIEAAGGDCTTRVFASHGMGPLIGGYLLLWEVLVRLGMGSDGGSSRTSSLRRFQYTVKDRVPKQWVPFAQRVARIWPLRRVKRVSPVTASPPRWSSRPAGPTYRSWRQDSSAVPSLHGIRPFSESGSSSFWGGSIQRKRGSISSFKPLPLPASTGPR